MEGTRKWSSFLGTEANRQIQVTAGEHTIRRTTNAQEKLRLTMIDVASRAHSHCWKMNDDTKDSFPALLDISLDDMESVYHLCGIYDKNTRKFIAKDLEAFMMTMDRTVVEMLEYNKERYLRLGRSKLKDSSMKPKLQCKKGMLFKLPNNTNAIQLRPKECLSLAQLVEEAKANIMVENDKGDPHESEKGKPEEAIADDPFSSLELSV